MTIDTTINFAADAGGKDPDSYSPTLYKYHAMLWSKPLPNGTPFQLTIERQGRVHRLRHESDAGTFTLSSDTLANSSRGPRRAFYEQMPPGVNERWHVDGGTIGGRLVFPANRVDGQQTFNQARGWSPAIKDRFDLTLESIRRHYDGGESPLSEVLSRYDDFFGLFESFRGYAEFFLLQDLVAADTDEVRFYLPFDEFGGSPLPATYEEYVTFRDRQLEFVGARNERILDALADL
ncbi:DUF6994 family protein [Microbacterium sp. LRZ72]|uniref:DUF6994 family protein n=1 Tax=Microbacterium sp. LRZ72 TaxID=2942481 RepID=UPI0029C0B123|nr:hypothetical protein [Microbacterium sp. LRZ72]